MKKKLPTALALILTLGLLMTIVTPVSADDASSYTYTDKVEQDIENSYDGKLNYGDKIITKSAIQKGLDLEKELNEKDEVSFRMDEEVYTVKNVKVIKPFGYLKANYLRDVGAGVSVTDGVSATVSIGKEVLGYSLGASVSKSVSYSYSGPDTSKIIGSGAVPTQRIYSAIMSGTINEYTFEVRMKYSNAFVRTEVANFVNDETVMTFANDISLQDGGQIVYRSANSNVPGIVPNIKYLKEKINGDKGWKYILFSKPFYGDPDQEIVLP